MKELSIEEKAKRYDKALERAKKAIKYYDKPCFVKVDEIFPELKESEDERIRKEIINVFKSLGEHKIPTDINFAGIFTWLEKQGKHPQAKSAVKASKEEKVDNANKVEPKFKIEDWVVYECGEDSAILQIKNIVYDTYEFTDDSTLNVADENTLRLWTIQDAKAGDVLVDNECNVIGLFEKVEGTHWYSKFYYNPKTNLLYGVGVGGLHNTSAVSPATKKQRDTLIKLYKAKYHSKPF